MLRAAAVLILACMAAFTAWPAGRARAPRSGFEARVAGPVEAHLSGRASFGVNDVTPDGGVTMELESDEDGGTLLLQWPPAMQLEPGTYRVGVSRAAGVVRVLFAAGPALPVPGAWLAERGTVRIRHASAGLLTGTLALAMGEMRITGTFIAIAAAPQVHTTH